MVKPLKINAQRLWDSLMLFAKIGATDKGGCNRQALTDLDKQARDLWVSWAEDAGCSIRIDTMGNIFARREGCLLYTSPSPRDRTRSRMPSSA